MVRSNERACYYSHVAKTKHPLFKQNALAKGADMSKIFKIYHIERDN